MHQKLLAGIGIAACLLATLAGCSSLQEMAKQQDDYNRSRCHDQYGLVQGSSEYARCVSMGANAYADAQKAAPAAGTGTAGAIVIAPGGIIIPTAGAPPANNACTAPSSPKGQCSGCSVSCADKQASCTAGTEWPDGSGCIKSSECTCH